ncbi:hypothetical protein GOP47_0000457 [Adiantum capillus-veneris]|uniref:Uncharacterized protein n=1 Tax=Adiantum capillus-veneris TaxID=13818 RepID=A0A9D4VF03_ADICA|nr:hypothetical protein GOP47_0000457 [Adiantum capillus-veneris]
MPLRDIALGRYNELMDPEPLKAGFAELVATFFFVFIGEGSSIAYVVVSGSSTLKPMGLLIAAICHGFAIYVAIANSYHVSGGHVNPAVTVGLLVGGYITVFKSILYIIMQLVGAILASLLLKYATDTASLPLHAVGGGDNVGQALVLEIVMTFILLYTIYARAVDPRAKETSSSAPLTVGLLVTALILCGGPFSSCSLNPARSFGPALVSWSWDDHWIYWVGPILGAALAGVVYELIYIETSPPTSLHERLEPSDDY